MRLYEQLPASERHEPGCRITVIDRQSLGEALAWWRKSYAT